MPRKTRSTPWRSLQRSTVSAGNARADWSSPLSYQMAPLGRSTPLVRRAHFRLYATARRGAGG